MSVTEYTMSEIIASVYETMEKTGKREGICSRVFYGRAGAGKSKRFPMTVMKSRHVPQGKSSGRPRAVYKASEYPPR